MLAQSPSSIACEDCGTSFVPTNGRQRFCSGICRYRTRDRRRFRTRGTVVEIACIDCGAPFTFVSATKPPKRCEHCREAFIDYVRNCSERLRRLGLPGTEREIVTRRDIFERDGWVCQICRQPVDRTADARSSRAPSVDHIIPLHAGGGWTWANLQTAHHGCNNAKH